MQERCLSVVTPVYNEEATLEKIVSKVVKLPQLLEMILVDDCSGDRTPDILRGVAARYRGVIVTARHARNLGKTEALKTGFRLTRGDIVIVQDADLEYDPAEIPTSSLPFSPTMLTSFSATCSTRAPATSPPSTLTLSPPNVPRYC